MNKDEIIQYLIDNEIVEEQDGNYSITDGLILSKKYRDYRLTHGSLRILKALEKKKVIHLIGGRLLITSLADEAMTRKPSSSSITLQEQAPVPQFISPAPPAASFPKGTDDITMYNCCALVADHCGIPHMAYTNDSSYIVRNLDVSTALYSVLRSGTLNIQLPVFLEMVTDYYKNTESPLAMKNFFRNVQFINSNYEFYLGGGRFGKKKSNKSNNQTLL